MLSYCFLIGPKPCAALKRYKTLTLALISRYACMHTVGVRNFILFYFLLSILLIGQVSRFSQVVRADCGETTSRGERP